MSAHYHIKGNLSEKQIEADVASYLGWCSEGVPFRLLDVNEQATGADKRCDVTVPIYIQFKKAEGLKPWSAPLVRRRSNESPLQEIRRFRHRNQFADNPTLFFGLRAKAKHATEFQHNVLWANHQPSTSYAIYVAPLHLDKDVYFQELCAFPRFRGSAWHWQYTNLHGENPVGSWLRHFYLQPFLRSHITIPPHQLVSTHEHHYAFSTTGDQVSWHSPEILDNPISRLSDFMSARTRDIILGSDDLPSPETAVGAAERALRNIEVDPQLIFSSDTPFGKLRDYGRWLWKTHDIRQMLICTSREDRESIRKLANEW